MYPSERSEAELQTQATPDSGSPAAAETAPQTVTREVEIDAPVEDVFEAIATEEGRERWLEYDPGRELVVEHNDPPRRIAWWWWSEEEPARRVEIRVVSIPDGTRVTVTETAPATLPLMALAQAAASPLVFA